MTTNTCDLPSVLVSMFDLRRTLSESGLGQSRHETCRPSPLLLRTATARDPQWLMQPREPRRSAPRHSIWTGDRDPHHGDLAPWMLGTREVTKVVAHLILHGLHRLGLFEFGPPHVTARGVRMLDGWTDLRVFGDQS